MITISNSSYEKILGVYFDNKLNFKTHINNYVKKSSQKLPGLVQMSTEKNIMNAFILSQFSYMDVSLNSLINKIHGRAIRIAHNDNISSFEQLLKLSGSLR